MNISKTLLSPVEGIRLDKFLVSSLSLTRSQVGRLIRGGQVTVEGSKVKPGYKLKRGEKIKIVFPEQPAQTLVAEAIPLNIVYEDEDIVVVDKPAGLSCHPGPGHRQGTLVNALLAKYPHLPGEFPRPGLVHRLDKDTSGLIIIAKNQPALEFISRQFRERKVVKRYLVLVKDKVYPEEGVIEVPIARHPKARKKMAVIEGGRLSRSKYRALIYFKEFTLLEVIPETGRTHQIRVQLAYIGHPVVGDRLYGVKVSFLNRQFLHACYLKFKLPSGRELELTSPLPEELRQAIEQLALSGFKHYSVDSVSLQVEL